MQNFILLIVSASAFLQGAAQTPIRHHNDLFFDNLRGRIEEVKEIPYSVNSKGNTGAADSCCVSILAYDRNGYRTMDVSEDASGKGRGGQIYTKRYNNGKPKEIQFVKNGKVVSTLRGTLAKDGSLGTARTYDKTGKLVYFYDEVKVNSYGKVIFMKSFKPDSTLLQTIVNNYQEQIWVGGSIKDSSGGVVFATRITLNDKLYPAEVEETQSMNGHLSVTRIKYVYDRFDENGNWIQRRELNDKGDVRKIIKREIRYRKS
jgi:antitoxin component YwqK of YwqJK toxin-antitoxin module